MPKLYLSHIDIVNDQFVEGWAFNRVHQNIPLRLRFLLDDQVLGSMRAEQPRQDVVDAGLHRSGRCGFVFRLPANLKQDFNNLRIQCGAINRTIFSAHRAQVGRCLELGKPQFFMHIPKTAGTSFNNQVRSWFGFNRWHTHIETLNATRIAALATDNAYLAGHLPMFRQRELLGDLNRFDLHCLLREPYSQLRSHLGWLKGIAESSDQAFIHQHPEVVQKLARRMQRMQLFDPAELRRFALQITGFELDFFDNIQTRYFLFNRPQKVTADDLARAITNMALFETIGITEDYHGYLDKVADFCGKTVSKDSAWHNPSKIAPIFDLNNEDIRLALEPMVRFDLLLYDAALRMLG